MSSSPPLPCDRTRESPAPVAGGRQPTQGGPRRPEGAGGRPSPRAGRPEAGHRDPTRGRAEARRRSPPIVEKVVPRPVAVAWTAVHVGKSGSVTVELVRDGRRYALPADVPPGAYRVSATFGADAPTDLQTAHVEAGSALTVGCNERVKRCTVN